MDLQASNDFGARDFDGKGARQIHNHLFLGANTGCPRSRETTRRPSGRQEFLEDKKVRVDVFALREGGVIDGKFLGPIRPESPTLKTGRQVPRRGRRADLERGPSAHPGNGRFQRDLGRAGRPSRTAGSSAARAASDRDGAVDPFSHFINVYMLDRKGNRIDRRNPQDIFVPLYNKQIPPGAGQVVHFALEVPEDQSGPITLEAKVNYRKFDRKYMDYVFGKGQGPDAAGCRDGEGHGRSLPSRAEQPPSNHDLRRSRPTGSAGMITASASCSKGAPREARRAS